MNLGVWAKTQRAKRNKSQLTDTQISRLDAIGFVRVVKPRRSE